ncbi:MAG: hypothetical protein N4A61_00215 [Pelagimonas sp.]|jgi:hypothetical protein|nr:hypothetical protein [Pelagimonas sp.]
MKAMMIGFAATLVIGLGAWYALGEMGFSSSSVYSGVNVRLD